MAEAKKKILDVENLRVYFHTKKGDSKAVDGNNFQMYENETLAIVGESGCGKSVTAMSILGLVAKPGEIMPGSKITYLGDEQYGENGIDLTKASDAQVRNIRGNHISMIFQEPMTSLNPVFTVGDQIAENIQIHENVSNEEAKQRTIKLLSQAGISRPEQVINNYPFQLSGGMCQRVMIAMALSCNPKLLIADEPTTALDVTIQAQILMLMNNLKEELGTSIMLITHDLGVVAQVADRVNVMYAGKVVETAPVRELFKKSKTSIYNRLDEIHAVFGNRRRTSFYDRRNRSKPSVSAKRLLLCRPLQKMQCLDAKKVSQLIQKSMTTTMFGASFTKMEQPKMVM